MSDSPPSKRLAWMLIASTLAFTALVYLAIATILRDDSPPDDRDMAVLRQEVKESENAYSILLAGVSEIYLPEESREEWTEMLRGEKWNDALAQDILTHNEENLSTWRGALATPEFQVPNDYRIDLNLSYASAWQKLTEVALLQAFAVMHDGREVEAFEQCFEVLHFGQRIENCAGGMIHVLVGCSIKTKALKAMSALLAQSKMLPQELQP